MITQMRTAKFRGNGRIVTNHKLKAMKEAALIAKAIGSIYFSSRIFLVIRPAAIKPSTTPKLPKKMLRKDRVGERFKIKVIGRLKAIEIPL